MFASKIFCAISTGSEELKTGSPLRSNNCISAGTFEGTTINVSIICSGTGTFKSGTAIFSSGTGTFKSGTTKSLASPSPQTGLFQPTGTTPLKSQKELTSGTKTFSSGTGTFKSSETTTFPSGTGTFKSSETTTFPSGTGTFKSALAVFSSAGA